MLQFQSTLSYLKDPPEGYANEGVDIEGGLDDIKSKVQNGNYGNEYDFENDIAGLLVKAHDGHLSFEGMAYAGAFRWRRNRQIALMSASSDGKEAPKIWAIQDFNQTSDGSWERSAVSKIDGKDAAQFVEEESLLSSYHDPDTRYNAMFYMTPAESFGYFTNPPFYPGASVNLTFENGTSNVFKNSAIILDYTAWEYIVDGDSFYDTYISPSGLFGSAGSKKLKKRSPYTLPRKLQHHRDAELDSAYVPLFYPDPVVEHSSPDVALAGYFVDSPAGKVGVLMVQTFNTNDSDSDESEEFQGIVEDYINNAKEQNVAKHIIDLRTNGGGKVLLGYDMYLQFFPSQEPQLQARYRGHKASELIGSSLSTIGDLTYSNGDLYTSPFNYHSYLDKDLNNFTSWEDMYPPSKFHDDSFTDLLRYNLSDPLTTSSEEWSIGVTMTSYGDRSNFTNDPFKPEDLIILSDGICASTCSLFTELMVQQSGVKTLAVGGRPNTGPMQPVGGTKGSLVLQSDYLIAISDYVVSNFDAASDAIDSLPTDFAIMAADASINFQDNIRKGLEQDGTPTQFLNDTASCRIWYESDMYLNVTALWSKAAAVAFGKDGGLDEDACIAGSVTSKESQQGQGEGNPTPAGGGGNGNSSPSPTGKKGAAAGAMRPSQGGWTAMCVCAAVVVGSMAVGAGLI